VHWLRRLFSRDASGREKQLRIDRDSWEKLRALTIDPDAIVELVMFVMSDEPPISGATELEFVVSSWASTNPTLSRVALKGAFHPQVRVGVVPASWGAEGLSRAASSEPATLIERAKSEGRRVGVAVQVKDITRLPSGMTGPGKFCILTVWRHDRPGDSPLVITDRELLPERDPVTGRDFVEFREE
jgi:hypothetical protein